MNSEQKEDNYRLAEELLSEQSFLSALVAGVLAMLTTAAAWAMYAAAFGYTWSIMAMGVGVAVGYAIQVFGKGLGASFVVLAALLAVAGCALGHFLAAIMLESVDHQISPIELLSSIPLGAVVEFIAADFGLIDLMFWIVAVSLAGYFSLRRLTRKQQLAIFSFRHK